ncbi:integrase core domain-containing protein [Streptomyces sp. OZ13]|uniref:integrase core domain-containing protein n=1 Tax=Streptomyces sp. OZ13 TaxID=3452210 RepID=UPI003F89667F
MRRTLRPLLAPDRARAGRPPGRSGQQRGQRARGVLINATCKRETLQDRRTFADEREARLSLFRWLHRYNTVRRHSTLGRRSPIAYETALDTPSTTLAPAA